MREVKIKFVEGYEDGAKPKMLSLTQWYSQNTKDMLLNLFLPNYPLAPRYNNIMLPGDTFQELRTREGHGLDRIVCNGYSMPADETLAAFIQRIGSPTEITLYAIPKAQNILFIKSREFTDMDTFVCYDPNESIDRVKEKVASKLELPLEYLNLITYVKTQTSSATLGNWKDKGEDCSTVLFELRYVPLGEVKPTAKAIALLKERKEREDIEDRKMANASAWKKATKCSLLKVAGAFLAFGGCFYLAGNKITPKSLLCSTALALVMPVFDLCLVKYTYKIEREDMDEGFLITKSSRSLKWPGGRSHELMDVAPMHLEKKEQEKKPVTAYFLS